MMKRIATLLLAFCALFITGCATQDYHLYSTAQVEIAKAHAAAESARYDAMARIAASGSDTARVAAMMAMQAPKDRPDTVAAPRPASDQLLQALGILAPVVAQGYVARQNAILGMRQSDNAASVGISANSTFLGLGRAIQAPQANQYSLSYSAPYTSTVMANGDTAVTGAVKK